MKSQAGLPPNPPGQFNDDDVIATALKRREKSGSVLNHSVTWNPNAWRRGLSNEKWIADTLDRLQASSESHISRQQVSDFAGDLRGLFLASNIWGFGTTGYGPARTARMIASAGDQLVSRLDGVVSASLRGPGEAWDSIRGHHKIRGLGVTFGTKLAYFASLSSDQMERRPLIADINTSWGVWDVARIPRSVELRDSYLKYVEYAQQPKFSGYRADEIELALFEIGQKVRRFLR